MKLTIVNEPDSGQSATISYLEVASGNTTNPVTLAPGGDLVVEITNASQVVISAGELADGVDPVVEPLVPATPVSSDQASAATGPVAVVSTDPAVTGGVDAVLITQDTNTGEVLTTPIDGTIDPSQHTVTVDSSGTPTLVAAGDSGMPVPVLGDTALAPADTPAPTDPSHVDAATSTIVPVTLDAGSQGGDPTRQTADAGAAQQADTAAEPAQVAADDQEAAQAAPTAVVTTDPAAGADTDSPVILTTHPDTGDVLATPITSGDPSTITAVGISPDGSPTVVADATAGSAPIVLGDTAPAPDGTPQLAQLVDAGTATDVSVTGTAPTHEDIATVIQSCIDNDATLTAQGYVSIDELNTALVANGFAPVTTETATAAHDAVLGTPGS